MSEDKLKDAGDQLHKTLGTFLVNDEGKVDKAKAKGLREALGKYGFLLWDKEETVVALATLRIVPGNLARITLAKMEDRLGNG